MATVSITYTALNAPVEPITPQICDILTRYNNAASMSVFDGTYYDTRVAPGIGEATSLADFVGSAVAHPGLSSKPLTLRKSFTGVSLLPLWLTRALLSLSLLNNLLLST